MSGRLIHALRASSENQKGHGEEEVRGQRDERETDGGGEVGEDHCFDEADALGQGRRDQVGRRGDDVGGEEERPQLAFGERELGGEEIGYPARGHDAGAERVDGEEETDFDEDEARRRGDGRPDRFFWFWL